MCAGEPEGGMSGNRVEELEAKVRELEATIDGLTDELVETKERLEAVEKASDLDDDELMLGRSSRSERRETTETAESPDDEDASADEVNNEEGDGEDNADSESGDDIIVA